MDEEEQEEMEKDLKKRAAILLQGEAELEAKKRMDHVNRANLRIRIRNAYEVLGDAIRKTTADPKEELLELQELKLYLRKRVDAIEERQAVLKKMIRGEG